MKLLRTRYTTRQLASSSAKPLLLIMLDSYGYKPDARNTTELVIGTAQRRWNL
jgi:hypothetical protein